MSRLKGATDLGITIPTTPTLASLGGAKNTVTAGLPPFTGRSTGDHHFDSTAGKEYVLSGTAGTSYTDDFGRTGNISGSTTTTGSGTWTLELGTSPTMVGGVLTFASAATKISLPQPAGDVTISVTVNTSPSSASVI